MRPPSQLARLLICLQVLLLAVFMTVEVSHSHPVHAGGHDDSIHCELCATAHVATAHVTSWPMIAVLHAMETITPGEPLRGSRRVVRTAFIRPPPLVVSSLV